MDDRFQNQPWYIKLWRYRYYLPIPWCALKCWWLNRHEFDEDGERGLLFTECWGICIGTAQYRMKWYYTQEEMEERLGWNKEKSDG